MIELIGQKLKSIIISHLLNFEMSSLESDALSELDSLLFWAVGFIEKLSLVCVWD